MEEKVDIVALGELLIDFTEAGHSQDGRKLFEQNPGGAPANLLTVASHFGYRTSFIGKVGNDMHGKFLKKTLQKEGINTDAIVEDPGYFTTLAFVEIGENGERNFSFARKPGADTQLKKEELDQTLISGCRIFHFGSLSLTDEPAESTTIEAVKMAKAAGALIIKAFQTHAVDTTGAGDSFWGGVLCSILSINKPVEKMEWEEIRKCAVLGNAVAGLCVQKRGGIPAIPTKEAVLEFMQK